MKNKYPLVPDCFCPVASVLVAFRKQRQKALAFEVNLTYIETKTQFKKKGKKVSFQLSYKRRSCLGLGVRFSDIRFCSSEFCEPEPSVTLNTTENPGMAQPAWLVFVCWLWSCSLKFFYDWKCLLPVNIDSNSIYWATLTYSIDSDSTLFSGKGFPAH